MIILLTSTAMQPFGSQPATSFVFWLKAHNKKGQPLVYTVSQIVSFLTYYSWYRVRLTDWSPWFRMSIQPLAMPSPLYTLFLQSGSLMDRWEAAVGPLSFSETWPPSSFSPYSSWLPYSVLSLIEHPFIFCLRLEEVLFHWPWRESFVSFSFFLTR